MNDVLNALADLPHETGPAAGYLIEMLESMSALALAADLPNSSATLAAAARLVEQECRYIELTKQSEEEPPQESRESG